MPGLRRDLGPDGNKAMKRKEILYVIGKDGQKVYNVTLEELIEEYYMAINNVPLLAADAANVAQRDHTIVGDFASGKRMARDFDITFTVGEDDVAAVRLKESAARALYDKLGEEFDNTTKVK